MYLNTSIFTVYKCTSVSGNTMTWTYAGDLQTGILDVARDYADAVGDEVYDVATARRYVYYAYANDSMGAGFSLSDRELQYRGICITTEIEAPTTPEMYMWEINPVWASKYADRYLHEVYGGLAIYSDALSSDTYAGLSALALTFYLEGIRQMKVGYEDTIEDYGVIAKNLIALGSGAGIKFDNYGHSSEGARGRFTWEVRDNGHCTLKLY